MILGAAGGGGAENAGWNAGLAEQLQDQLGTVTHVDTIVECKLTEERNMAFESGLFLSVLL